jgi:hypothetical protein
VPDPAALAEHLAHLWPEMLGGFCGFFVHTIHHRLFKTVLRLAAALVARASVIRFWI